MKLQPLLVTFALLFSSVIYGEQTSYLDLEKRDCKKFKLGDLVIEQECTYYKPEVMFPIMEMSQEQFFGSFNNGKKNGFFSHYSGAGDKLSMQTLYKNGVLQYMETFIQIKRYGPKHTKKRTHI